MKAISQDEISLLCLKSVVLPVLNRVDKFSRSIDLNTQSTLKILYTVAETLVLFQNSEEFMINYKNLKFMLNLRLRKIIVFEKNSVKAFTACNQQMPSHDWLKRNQPRLMVLNKKVWRDCLCNEQNATAHPETNIPLQNQIKQLIYTIGIHVWLTMLKHET